MRKRLIVDMSSMLWTALLAGKDKEFGIEVMFTPEPTEKNPKPEPKKVLVNSAQYGYENLINHFVSVLNQFEMGPMDMILVVEGLNSKLMRQNILPQYKAGRDRPDEAYIEFQKLRDMIIQVFTSLGAIAVTQDGIEADDVIMYLCMHLDGEKIIDSNDGDLATALSDGTTLTKDVTIWKQSKGQRVVENPYGPFACRYVPIYKAIVGDTGDKIPGAKGFGEKTWLDFLCNYDDNDLATIEQLILTKQLSALEEDVPNFKPLQKILDNREMVYKSYRCARLYPNLVNTVRRPLQWTPGMVKPRGLIQDERLNHWAGAVRLVHAANFQQAFDWMKQHISESPFISFDIETSATDTAEQWLETAKTKSNESKDAESVDVFGAELTSFSLTFGRNMQYTCFFTVNHRETDKIKNISKAQAKQVLEALPKSKVKAIQNVSFELPIIMAQLGPLQECDE
jgi:5'-3' exonuclease